MGLGNAGAEYLNTRHNVGIALVGKLATWKNAAFSYNKYCNANVAKIDIAGHELILTYADSFMNLSGESLNKILKFYKISPADCAVLHDDINMQVGRLKLSKGGSAGGHNGIADLMNKCGNDFVRVRIGVGSKPDKRMDLADYVLGKLDATDSKKIDEIDIVGCMRLIISNGFEAAQNIFNRKDTTIEKPDAKDSKKSNALESIEGEKPDAML